MNQPGDPKGPRGTASRRLVEAILDTSPVGVALTDPDSLRVTYANTALGTLLGTVSALLPGEVLAHRLVPGEEAETLQQRIRSGQGVGPVATRLQAAKGEPRWVSLTVEPLAMEDGLLVLWWVVDAADTRQLEQRLGASLAKEHDLKTRLEALDLTAFAQMDPLTGALPLSRFLDAGESLLITSRHSHEPVGCLSIEVEGFDALRDRQGYGAADDVLKTVAQACRRSLRQIDLFGVLGDGRFGAALPGVPEEQLQRLRTSLVKTLSVHTKRGLEGRFRFPTRIGATLVAPGDVSFRAVLDRAAKAAEPNSFPPGP